MKRTHEVLLRARSFASLRMTGLERSESPKRRVFHLFIIGAGCNNDDEQMKGGGFIVPPRRPINRPLQMIEFGPEFVWDWVLRQV